MANEDPLQKLIADDAGLVDREKVANFLMPFVLIDAGTKQLSFLPEFTKVRSNADKIEIILLACKARALFFKTLDGLTQGEIISLDTMPEGSAKTAIKNLFDTKKIKKDKARHYFLPGYRVEELVNKQTNKK
jgi:hypothetical protein